MMAGFGWEIGAFESWDVLGVEGTVKKMKEAGIKVASWVEEMLDIGQAIGDADLLVTAHGLACSCYCFAGELTKVLEHADKLLNLLWFPYWVDGTVAR